MSDPRPAPSHRTSLPRRAAVAALARCVVTTCALLARRRIHLPRGHVGTRLAFGDGTSARVYRETVVDADAPRDPCTLVVEFRLRFVRGRGHTAFRAESLLNTPLFAGFPGFASKLWVAHDHNGVYRGVYEWDGPDRAEFYAQALRHVLALVCVPGSIQHTILPGTRRDYLLVAARPTGDAPSPSDPAEWWRVIDTHDPSRPR